MLNKVKSAPSHHYHTKTRKGVIVQMAITWVKHVKYPGREGLQGFTYDFLHRALNFNEPKRGNGPCYEYHNGDPENPLKS
jgi:hypothetical protein